MKVHPSITVYVSDDEHWTVEVSEPEPVVHTIRERELPWD